PHATVADRMEESHDHSKASASSDGDACCAALSLLVVGLASQQLFRPKVLRKRHHHHAGMTKVDHIVFIVKENRTFDHYFGTFPGADGATTGTISTGATVVLGQAPDRTPRDISHSFQSAVLVINGGEMDRFDLIPGANQNGDYLAYTQYHEADLPNYFTYAR